MRILLFWLLLVSSPLWAQQTFTNPLKNSGPDPWVLQHGDWYYYMNTTGRNLTLWRTHNMADLKDAESKVIFTPPPGTAYSRDLWAPEIHFLQNKWYVYFAADSINNIGHRMWVIENAAADPFEDSWTMKGKVSDPGDHWAIDMTVKEYNGRLYAAWSGWEGATNGQQNIYIAKLKNPWTMDGGRVRISQPDHEWERHGATPAAWQKNGEVANVYVNEGPEFLERIDAKGNRRLFLIYSANACWLDYCLGQLSFSGNGDLTDARQWRKHPQPVFVQAPENGVFAPGHGGFFTDSKGQNWMIYHANRSETDGCGNKRAPFIQPFGWKADGSPDFGRPLPIRPIPAPAD